MLYSVFLPVDHCLQERFADPEYVMREQPDRTFAIGDHALQHLVIRYLADDRLRRVQHVHPFAHQLFRRQWLVASALKSHELCDVFQVLSEDELFTSRDHGHVSHTELQQALATTLVVQDIDMIEGYAFARKKLFRPETAASPRLREQYELLSDGIHVRECCRKSEMQRLLPRCSQRQGEAASITAAMLYSRDASQARAYPP